MAAKKSKNNKKRRPRRLFTNEFRADVVRLCQSGRESVPEVCKRLDLTESAVRGWIRQAEQDAAKGTNSAALTASEKQELQKLRHENKQLKMERDILKKAAAFFAKENT